MPWKKLRGDGKFRWNEDHRLAIYLMKINFQLNGDDEVRVFNRAFGREDMKRNKISAQYGERDLEGKERHWQFRDVISPAMRTRHRKMQKRLHNAIDELKIDALGNARTGRQPPGTPPKAKKRKRSPLPLAVLSSVLTDDDNQPSQELSRHTADERAIEILAQIPANQLVPMAETSETIIPDKPTTPKTLRQEKATILYSRPSGSLMLTPEEFAKTKQPLEWPAIELGSPVLAFRYSVVCKPPCEPSCVCKSGHFVARRFRTTFGVLDPPDAPCEKHPGSFWIDAFNHLNNNRQDSPFVSVSNSLAWTLREAMKKSRNDNCEMNISLISLSDENAASYYAPLFHKELKKKYLFNKGAWLYQGTNEYLVYSACKPFITVPLSALMTWSSKHEYAGAALRLTDLARRGTCYHDILAKFKDQDIALTPVLAGTIAHIGVSLFGFTAQTKPEMWQAFVANVCEGWALAPKENDSKLALVTNFTHAVTRRSVAPVDDQTREILKMAFLTGTKFGMCDRTAIHRPIRFEQIEYKSTDVGLSSPAQLLIDYYDATKEHLWAYEAVQNGIIDKGKRSALVNAAAVAMRENVDSEEIMYEASDVEHDV